MFDERFGTGHKISDLDRNVAVGPGSPQYVWLSRDLVENSQSVTAKCTLAYWHHPLFTSGPSAGSNQLMRPIWNLLYDRGVDVVVNGHDHLYERFFPQTPDTLRSQSGITEYIVGTGGAPLYEFGPTAPNSAVKINRSYGVIRFTLRDVGWDSVFVEAGTGALLDNSVGNLCH